MPDASGSSQSARLREFARFPECGILAISLALFLWFLNANLATRLFDENHYADLAALVWERGPLFRTDLHAQRTYLYPMLLSLIWPVTGGDPVIFKVVVALIQYGVLAGTVCFLASRVNGGVRGRRAVLVAGLWNPYWVQSTTLLLTDSLAACGFVVAVSNAWRSDLNRWPGVISSVGLAACVGMLRPAALPALGLVFAAALVRIGFLRDVKGSRFLVRCVVGLLPLGPQLLLNLRNFGVWSILPELPMYRIQLTWAVHRLRWVTSTDPDNGGGIVYANPVEVSADQTLMSALIDAPSAFAIAYGSHLFHLLDWGYVDIFVDDLYAPSRLVGSAFVYTTWGLVLLGMLEQWRRRRAGEAIEAYWLVLALASCSYGLFIATTQMETRYAYPVLLLVLPFCGPGVDGLARFGARRSGSPPFLRILSAGLAYGALVVSLWALSLTLDLTTGRVDWFTYYLG